MRFATRRRIGPAEPRRHQRLLDLGAAAQRAGDEAAPGLFVVGRGICEPAFEFVMLVADESVPDHTEYSDHMKMRRLRHRLDDLETPAVLKRRDAAARGGDGGEVDVG